MVLKGFNGPGSSAAGVLSARPASSNPYCMDDIVYYSVSTIILICAAVVYFAGPKACCMAMVPVPD